MGPFHMNSMKANRTMNMGETHETVNAPDDPTAWLIHNPLAEFLLVHSHEIKYMAMLGYTFLHGVKLFKTLPKDCSTPYKYVSMIFQCTGGGTLVPIFINAIPVALAKDSYPIAITLSFLLHLYLPIVREIFELSYILQAITIGLYEIFRANVVIHLTEAAAKAIAPSEFSFAVFGPIFCGTVAGCGGAFLPLDKGLNPIKDAGLAQPMWSAFVGATFYHLFMNTSLSAGVVDASRKAHLFVVLFFITHHAIADIRAHAAQHHKQAEVRVKTEPTKPKETKKKQ